MAIEETDMLVEMKRRGEEIAPVLPGANWITIKGNFTPDELVYLANLVRKSNGNKN